MEGSPVRARGLLEEGEQRAVPHAGATLPRPTGKVNSRAAYFLVDAAGCARRESAAAGLSTLAREDVARTPRPRLCLRDRRRPAPDRRRRFVLGGRIGGNAAAGAGG